MVKKSAFFPILPLVLSTPNLSFASEWVHEGGPPFNTAFIDWTSDHASEPIQFVGTLNPPSLLMNGKPIRLSRVGDTMTSPTEATRAPGLWMEGREIKISGREGRFYLELSAEEAAVPEVRFRMRSRDGKTLGGVVRLNRIFLDAPIHSRKWIRGEELKNSTHAFSLTGKIPSDAELIPTQGKITPALPHQGREVRLDLDLSEGASTLSAELRQRGIGGSTRIFNIPQKVTRTPYDPNTPVFSLKLSDGNSPKSPIHILAEGAELPGYTNPEAHLSLADGVDHRFVEIEKDGSFTLSIPPQAGCRDLRFQLKTANGQEHHYVKQVCCTDCPLTLPEAHSWYAPAFRQIGDNYLSLSGAWGWIGSESRHSGEGSFDTQSLLVNPFGLGLGAGRPLLRNLNIEISALWLLPSKYSAPNWGGRETTLNFGMVLGLEASWFPWRFFSIGSGLKFLIANIHTRIVFSSSGSSWAQEQSLTERAIAPFLAIGGRIALSRRIEVTPRLWMMAHSLSIPIGGSSQWNGFFIEPLVLRYYW